MDEDEIPFGSTRETITGTAPPLDVEDSPPRQPDYWLNSGTGTQGIARTCRDADPRPGHGVSPDDGWVCTRAAGHPGPHIACAAGLNVVAVWEDAAP